MPLLTLLVQLCITQVYSQDYVSNVWVANQNDGTNKNPILHADYSDPDVCRVEEDYYLVSSSFNAVPGLPILHSRDLVNWKIIGHALKLQHPIDHFSKVQHGNGVWAPSIRYHSNEFWIYYPDPDFGIYLTKAKEPQGPWSDPILVEGGKGLIDPCPLWDDDGRNYLVHAYAGSRAGIKSVLVIKELSEDGSKTISKGRVVYDGHQSDPTVEGPKFYKRNGYYYIFAPAGGVSTGWQLALRSKSIYGPYERKVVMDQGTTDVNGPHQGAWVDTTTGEDWFIHFQDKGAYGRVVHLQPMKWVKDWPVIGLDKDNDGKGEPVQGYKKPNVGRRWPVQTPLESDEFNSLQPGLQWQWQANPQATWSFMDYSSGSLRLYSQMIAEKPNFWEVPNLLLQKIPAEEFTATTKLAFYPNAKLKGERAGLILMGQRYASVSIESGQEGMELVFSSCDNALKEDTETKIRISSLNRSAIYFRLTMTKGGMVSFYSSLDGKTFQLVREGIKAEPGKWIGAKIGIFCTRHEPTNDSGYADFDWFRIEKVSVK